MYKRILSLILVLLLCTAAIPLCVQALDSRLYDGADILTVSEEAYVLHSLDRVSDEYGVDIVVAIASDLGDYSADTYVEYFYDNNLGSSADGALLLLSMAEREYRILSNGMVGDAIDGDAIDSIGDAIVSDLSDGAYADAFVAFAEECAYYIDGHLNGFPFPALRNLGICLVVGLVIALIVTGVMCAQLKSVRKQQGAGDYTRAGSMRLTHSSDLFLYRNVTRVKIQSSSSSSGGRGGGSRHVGGGRF